MDWKAIIESKIESQVMSRLKNEEDSEYQKFFQTVLKKFKVDSPAELDDAGNSLTISTQTGKAKMKRPKK